MQNINEFAKKVAEKFAISQKTIDNRWNLSISESTVENFIRAAFYASMIPDEGRYPTACMMCYRMDANKELAFSFTSSCKPEPAEIAKLSHAVADGSHICVISNNDELKLAGFNITVLNDLRHLGYSSHRVGNPLRLLIRGPGHIEVSTGGTAMVYKGGYIRDAKTFQYTQVIKKLATSVTKELREEAHGAIESLEDIFNDIAEEIVRLGHGGLLLVVRRFDENQFSSHRLVNCLLLKQLLIRYWGDVAKLIANSGGVNNLLANNLPASQEAQNVASDTSMLEKCVNSIAHLSGMDGAIVMDYTCQVVAFNAIILRNVTGGGVPRFVDEHNRELSEESIGKGRGSRHKSALSFVKCVPGSFAFVVSQDGGVSAFHNLGNGTVLCELGLQVLD